MHPSSEHEGAIEMPRYQSHKKVWALKIAKVDGYTLSFAEPGYAPMRVDPQMFGRYTAAPGDYYVQYDDGYKSISPAKAFEEGYTRIKSREDMAAQLHKDMAVARAAAFDPTQERKNKID